MSNEHLQPDDVALPLSEVIERVEAAQQRLDAAEQDLITQRCLALGVAISRLALTRHGLTEEEVTTKELTDSAVQLINELEMSEVLSLADSLQNQGISGEKHQLFTGINNARASQGLSLRDLAAKSDISTSQVHAVTRGKGSMAAIQKVARALNLKISITPERDQ